MLAREQFLGFAHKQMLYNQKKLTILLNMAEDRNKAAHMYNETMAQEAASHIPEYAKTIKAILSRL